ncbi:hypothetical protein [Prescottella equi]|uniref:hypothetical protein n=1 Tax=Rhodococcus hoagii TaxID=43767 RepID=UPI00131D251A|nr:hypothetical protein [Prescottella equi]MBM4469832.1 hypothetical protein [Prescottella equi]NKZ84586.1 hypothetical protein [Prescottella equi]
MSKINPRLVSIGIRESADTVTEVGALVDYLTKCARTIDGHDVAGGHLSRAAELLDAVQVSLDDAMQALPPLPESP